jgi:hypothetical protein
VSISQKKVPPHWNYFLVLEEDISRLSRWIGFDKTNAKCFSLELARLLMVASSEVDVVAKARCATLEPNAKAASMHAYQEILMTVYPTLATAVVEMPQFGLTLKPWIDWKEKKTPPRWWTANNKVKHHRADFFREANLKNVLDSVAGLLILLLLHFGKDQASIKPAPVVFEPLNFAYLDGNFLVFKKS